MFTHLPSTFYPLLADSITKKHENLEAAGNNEIHLSVYLWHLYTGYFMVSCQQLKPIIVRNIVSR
jgi:hypothetical protein